MLYTMNMRKYYALKSNDYYHLHIRERFTHIDIHNSFNIFINNFLFSSSSINIIFI